MDLTDVSFRKSKAHALDLPCQKSSAPDRLLPCLPFSSASLHPPYPIIIERRFESDSRERKRKKRGDS